MPIGIITTSHSGVDVVFEWKIENVSNLPNCTWHWSPNFSFGGVRWYLGIFPNGWSGSSSSGHVDLELGTCDSDRSIKQSFSLSLKTGEKYNEQHFTKDFDNYNFFHRFYRFISRSELTRGRSELVPEVDLMVICTMKSSKSAGSEMELLEAKSKIDVLKLNCNQALQDKAEAQKKLRVLTNNFKDKEIELQRQLRAKEDDVNFAKRRIMLIEQENASYKSQVAKLEQEMEEKERILKSQIAAETNLENMEQEVTQLRQRLALLEREQENCANAVRDDMIRPVLKTCVEACTQTQKNALIQAYTQTQKHVLRQASTQTVKEEYEWFKEKSRNACVDVSTQTEEQNEEIKEMSTAEPDKTDTSEGARSDATEASSSNKTATKTEKPVSLNSLPAERDLVTDVKDLMNRERGIDVTFEVEMPNAKTEFIAHQLILALRSPYFADLFYGQGRNKEHQIIPLKGINTKAFEQMIRHCYDYKPSLRTTEDACALFKVAFEFKVISLQNLCHAFITHTDIEPGNVFNILKISVEMEDQRLLDMCYKILQEKTREVVANYELCDVTSAMVYTLLNLPKLSLNSEYELIKWIFDWAKVKSEDSSFKNAREYLEKFLKYMNLLALRFEEFAMLCKDNQEFFNPDEIGNISMNIAFPGTREMPDWYGKDLKCRVYTASKE